MSAFTPSRRAQALLARLVLPLVAGAMMAAAAAPASAYTDCVAANNKACAHEGGFCGTRKDPGHCQTIRRRHYRAVQVRCSCHPDHPHAY